MPGPKTQGPRRRQPEFDRRDSKALGALLEGAVALARGWTRGSIEGRNPVFPDVRAPALKAMIEEDLPRRGTSAKTILSEVRRKILPYLRDNGNPRFFGYVMSSPSAAGIAADLIASAIDQNVTAWRSAPAATELELLVVDWLRRIVGLPAGAGGLLTSGGSMATFTALAAARSRHAPSETARGGMGLLGKRMMTLYVSTEGHMSIARAAHLLGLGTDSVRIVPADGRYRIDTEALDVAIRADKRLGHLPFCVAVSAGTVNTGAVDPLRRVARVARKHRLWMHVDAAYGGPLGLSDEHRHLLSGIREADSVTLDPHKWLYAPLDVGCILFKDPAAPLAAFPARGEYAAVLAPGRGESFAFFDRGPDLSRRFRALKVWMILKYHGAERIGRRIAEEVALASHLGDLLEAGEETELLAPVETSIVCFRYVPRVRRRKTGKELDDLNERILLALQRAGRIYLTNARLRGRFALRACLMNFRTTEADVRQVVDEVVALGRRLAGR